MTSAAAAISATVPQGRGGQLASVAAGAGSAPLFDHGDSPSFSDLIDIINPLQHIPVINTVYRAITGDHESAMADIIGGTLYGGPVGLALAMGDVGLRDATGKDAGEHVMAWLGLGDKAAPASTTAVASAQTSPAATAAAAATAPKLVATAQPAAGARQTISVPGKPAATAATPTAAPTPLAPAADTASSAAAPVAPAATATAATSAMPTGDGPATIGDYLVFGAGASPTAPSATSAAAAPAPVAPTASAAPGPKTFATIGAGAKPAATLPPLAAAAAPGAAQPPVALVAGAQQPRIFPVPPRNGPSAPAPVLPPPTTGPGALPGNRSMALSAQEMVQQQGPQQNYLAAYSQALDKYRAMQQLQGAQGGGPIGLAPAVAPSFYQPATALAPTPLPLVGSDPGAVTVH